MCVIVLGTSGCSFFHREKKIATKSQPVMTIQPEQCFQTPKIQSELASVTATPCTQPHTLESYATIAYAADRTTPYPGKGVLTDFAKGKCAQAFKGYVGVDYLDSKWFFTFLLPSPRSWESRTDRTVVCFVTTTGETLTASVKGAKR